MRRLFKVGSDRHDKGRVVFTWHPDGAFLASAGKNSIVNITDRHGDIVDEVQLPVQAPILALAWDKDGENLAILQDGNANIPLWNLSSRKIFTLETNLKDPTFLSWSRSGPQLAVGTLKGNLLIYNKSNKKRIPIMGKHAKKISCGCWSTVGNKLVLGADDKMISFSNENGDTLSDTEVDKIPIMMSYMTHSIQTSNSNKDDTLAVNMDGKSILIITNLSKNEPLELSFAHDDTNASKCKYGDIKHYDVFDDNSLVIAFSLGYILTTNTTGKLLGQEINIGRFHKNSLTAMSYNNHLKLVATGGDDGVRFVDLKEFKENREQFIPIEDLEDGRITNVQWTPDGQILTVGTINGNIYNFLAKMNIVYATFTKNIAYLSSLREVSVVNIIDQEEGPVQVSLSLEPTLIAVGEYHIAANMNNRVYYHLYKYNNENTGGSMNNKGKKKSAIQLGDLINEQEYSGTIRDIRLNDTYVVVLVDSKAILHTIDPNATNTTTRNNNNSSSSSSSSSSKNNTTTTSNTMNGAQSITFPQREEGVYSKITCIAITHDFCYYGTEGGTVEIFYFNEWTLLPGAELRLDNSIKAIYPNHNGTKLIIIDYFNHVFLYNPITGGGVNQSILQFPLIPSTISHIIWDLEILNMIIIYDSKYIHTYIYYPYTMNGPIITKLGPLTISTDGSIHMESNKIEILNGNIPLTSYNGTITCQTSGGTLIPMIQPYIDHIYSPEENISNRLVSSKHLKPILDHDEITLMNKFTQCLAIGDLERAWKTALHLNIKECWLALGGKSVELLQINLAIRVYRQLSDAGMVLSLLSLQSIEDRLLLSGHIALLFNDYDHAQELFLLSSQPDAALNMRRDLLQWDQALQLAKALGSIQLSDISVYYGQNLEQKSEIELALSMFESAITPMEINGKTLPACQDNMLILAKSGIARCHIRLGNIRQGMHLVNELNIISLYEECGDLLEQQKQYQEAADMHIKGNEYERAAFIYTKYLIRNDKNKIVEAAQILHHVRNDQLNIAFAKICMSLHQYIEAMEAYSRAKEFDKVVELKLRYLDQIQEAFDLVRHHPSEISTQLVSTYCIENNNYQSAIEFLLLSNKNNEAFILSQTHNIMNTYTEILGDMITPDDAAKVAHYYEKAQNYGAAGRFYMKCAQYPRALKLFLQCGDREIHSAIEVVGKSNNDMLTHQLLDFLVGETDGIPKDSNYIYKLYIALKKYEEAGKTALIIANQEQEIGNYPMAHSVTYEAMQYLYEAKVKIPLILRQKFILLHSYLLIKSLVKYGDHNGAARLLQRIIQNISQFPLHTVQILTSAVIECQRANMKMSCYEYAVMLMKPEYRANIDPNLKRKIEAIVRRKTAQNEEAEDNISLCPICNQMTANYILECTMTHEAIPMCVITGRHMILDDWCFCPNSHAPALYSEYINYINTRTTMNTSTSNDSSNTDSTNTLTPTSTPNTTGSNNGNTNTSTVIVDPICNKPIDISLIQKCDKEEALKYIKRYNNMLDEEKREKGDKEDDENGDTDDINGEGGNTGSGENTINKKDNNNVVNKANVSRLRGKKVVKK